MKNLKNTIKKLSVSSLILTLTLSGCANAPSHLIVAPELTSNVQAIAHYTNKNINLSVQDIRPSNHFVQIMKEGKAATLINGQSDLAAIVQSGLSAAFAQQGLSKNSHATNQLQINIEKSLINVDQTLFDYKTNSEIALEAVLNNGQETLTKNFRVKGQSNGPLTPDLAVLGRDFNQQLAKVMNQIINDPDIQRMVK